MKFRAFVFVVFTLLFTSFATAKSVAKERELTALTISITGIGLVIDGDAYRKVTSIITQGINQRIINSYIVHDRFRNGGFSGCIAFNPELSINVATGLEKKLSVIRARASTYVVERIADCAPQIVEKFSGKIEQVNTGCFADGECYVVVAGKHITTTIGRHQQVVGRIIGVNSIVDMKGRNVDVYAAKLADGTYTLYGSKNYFINVK